MILALLAGGALFLLLAAAGPAEVIAVAAAGLVLVWAQEALAVARARDDRATAYRRWRRWRAADGLRRILGERRRA